MLMDSIEIYKTELEAAKGNHPNDKNICDIEGQVTVAIKKLTQSPENMSNSIPKAGNEDNCETEKGAEEATKDNNQQFGFRCEHEEIDPDEIREVELIEYLYSSQGIKDMEDYMDDMSMPSFSLGVEVHDTVMDICNNINKEHGDICNANAQPNEEDVVTPAVKPQEKRTKREAKLGAAYRSPYVRREIDLNAKYSTKEYAVWRWIIQNGKDKLYVLSINHISTMLNYFILMELILFCS